MHGCGEEFARDELIVQRVETDVSDGQNGGQVDQAPNEAGSDTEDRVFYDPLRLLHLIHFHVPPIAFWRLA